MNPAIEVPSNPSPETAIDVTVCILGQLESGIGKLSAEQYATAKDSKTTKNSSIGGHVRHVIEFYQALLQTLEQAETNSLSYDKRQRNLLFETSKEAALLEIETIRKKLGKLPARDSDLELSSIVAPEQPMFTMRTTLHRELVYLLDHMIHHMALIKILAKEHSVAFGENFGLAQSTKAHQRKPTQ